MNKLKLTTMALLLLWFFASCKKDKYNKVELDPNIKIRNLTDKVYLDTLINVGLQELKQSNVFVTVRSLIRTSDGDMYLRGYIVGEGNVFTIYVENNIRSEYPLLISHELIHLLQSTSGRLKVYKEGVLFDNVFYSHKTPYEYRPWENEAFYYDDLLEARIMKKLKPLEH